MANEWLLSRLKTILTHYRETKKWVGGKKKGSSKLTA